MVGMASPTCGQPFNTYRSQQIVEVHTPFQGMGAQSAAAPMNLTSQYPSGSLHTSIDTPLQPAHQPQTVHNLSQNAHIPGHPTKRWQEGFVGQRPPHSTESTGLSYPSFPTSGTPLRAPLDTLSPSLSVHAPVFIPGKLRRTNPVRISTPSGCKVTFEGGICKVWDPLPLSRRSVQVRMENVQQKDERLSRETK
ncbi:hypothetical protein ACGC1H_005043 [Rhizoctonia solani]|uniref:Uncharacterized protein n=1 Tax=Rhizoctonia solani TaxID=456999 RepID=A0A8H3BVZ4_9AGAM|nr:unnamed protein product [Rhizoctonia solani]